MSPKKIRYSNPVFSNIPSSPTSYSTPWTDPLPSQSQFSQPHEPLLQGSTESYLAPLHSRIMPSPSSSTSQISSTSQKLPKKKKSNASIGSANSHSMSPVVGANTKRPSRFASDFQYLRRSLPGTSRPVDPLPVSHRRSFSTQDANPALHPKRVSVFHEENIDEEDQLSDKAFESSESAYERGQGPVHQNVPLESVPGDLGVRFASDGSHGQGPINPMRKPNTFTSVSPRSDTDSLASDEEYPAKPLARKRSFSGILILLLCIYSTIGSFLFFVIAVARPRYGIKVSTTMGLRPASAQLISAIFAKTIELSFVSVFVAFLGQVLSRRALMTSSKGINIAELSMRSWVTQPGTLLTQTASVRFAGFTFLGALSLTASLFATFYTTASDTLVSPKLSWGPIRTRNLTGLVTTSYANAGYRSANCPTVITAEEDPAQNGYSTALSGATCSDLLSAGNGYRDLSDFLKLWVLSNTSSSTDPQNRPNAPSTHDLVNYSGYWMNVTGDNGINNATLALPHPGIISASRNVTLNHILQPEQAEGYGAFNVTGSVPNPALNVLCAPLNATTVKWFIAQSNTSDLRRNGTLDPTIQSLFSFTSNATYTFNATLNMTSGAPYEAPRFPKIPNPYNTVLSYLPTYDDPSIYLLARTNRIAQSFALCALKGFVTVNCSSTFQAFEGGGNMTVDCNPNNPLSYKEDLNRRHIKASFDTKSIDFKYVSSEVANSISLGAGVNDANAAVARLLTQLALDTPDSTLLPSRPSLAEALAVLFSNAAITSAVDTVFTTYYEYRDMPILDPPRKQYFSAIVQIMEYSSGAGAGWQPMFYIVLAGVLASNIFCLVYLLFARGGFVTDWTEVQNLFCVLMDGGGAGGNKHDKQRGKEDWQWAISDSRGPSSMQYNISWWVTMKKQKWYVTDETVHSTNENDIEMMGKRV